MTCRRSITIWNELIVDNGPLKVTSFEEFFAKKRIDLPQLEADNRVLYAAFRDHYAQMGEKSFDHSKKFWFNRLRKTYLLKEIEPEKPVPEQEEPPSAMDGDPQKTPAPISAPAAKPAGFKPRFKATAVAKPIETKPEETKAVEAKAEESAGGSAVPEGKKTEEKQPAAAKPAGFKPRFRPGITKTIPTKDA